MIYRMVQCQIMYLLILLSLQLSAQPTPADSTVVENWQVGLYEFPPYMMKNDDGEWKGISVELWQDLADSVGIAYQFQEVSQGEIKDQLESGRLNATLLLPVQAGLPSVTFSHIYHITFLGVATVQTQSLFSIAQGLFTMRFLRIVITLSILLLIVGTIVWLIERKSNDDSFGGERSIAQGIGSGFWWAGVTMTTIGYGDKAPVTFWGRAVALLWMLIAMAVTASLTAALVSAVGGGTAEAIEAPNGLRKKEVGTVADSPFGGYLDEENIKYEEFSSVEEGLKAVGQQELKIFAHSTATMRYWVNETSNITVQVKNTETLPQRYAIAYATNNRTTTCLDSTLIKIINQPNWQQRINRYMPK
ncbi:ion channel [Tunicatimonas pelagia]|uniref:ion channel n=1 Tax=Tunicatimonas pelagia TaxID=931531 RepID=UPI0026654776|nr:transporter substrate-binding domain-containing protein [Tunicatimonas pelagia]WKN40513.1 transporter substrate-binding domain-containing protein [Tunicatimonas pelagia]